MDVTGGCAHAGESAHICWWAARVCVCVSLCRGDITSCEIACMVMNAGLLLALLQGYQNLNAKRDRYWKFGSSLWPTLIFVCLLQIEHWRVCHLCLLMCLLFQLAFQQTPKYKIIMCLSRLGRTFLCCCAEMNLSKLQGASVSQYVNMSAVAVASAGFNLVEPSPHERW